MPRAASTDVGVRTCIASLFSLAIWPETTASAPRLTVVKDAPTWVVSLNSNLLSAIVLFGPTAKRLLSTKVIPIRPSAPVLSESPVCSSWPAAARVTVLPRITEAAPTTDLIRPISAALATAAVDSAAAISNPAPTPSASAPPFDKGQDIAQFRPEPEAEAGARLRADAAAVSAALRLARGFAADAGLEATVADQLAVVVEEWVANVVEHGGAQPDARIVLRLRLSGAVVRLSVSDAGRPFDPRAATFEGPNRERGGGAGLALIVSLCRIAGYARRAGRNRLTLELPLA